MANKTNKTLPVDFLRSLVVIDDTGNFTKAGERLGRSQSAVSLQIKKLEDICGHKLFLRQGHNFTLTPQGQILVNYGRQILALNDQALDELNPTALSGNIRFGIPSEFATSVLPKVLGEFSRRHPQVSLEVSCDLSRNLCRRFDHDEYDAVFTLSLLDNNEPNTNHHNIVRIDDLVWVSANPLALHNQQEVPLIVAPEGCLYRQQAIHWLNQTATPWRIVYTIVEISGIQAALEEGIGITVLAKTAVPDHLHILTNTRQTDLGRVGMQLTIHPRYQNPAVERLVEYIKQALQ